MLRKLARFVAPAVFALTALSAVPASAGDTVGVLVLKENGVGSSATAQGFVDKLVTQVAAKNGWAAAVGKYATSRKLAEAWIKEAKPDYAIMSLGAYLGLRKAHGLTVVGQAVVKSAGGRQYFVVSKGQGDLAGCKGQSLASDHLDDSAFVEGVVAAGDFKLADFQVVKTRRPVQTLKKVIRGEAACALIDDAQLASLGNLEGGAEVKSVWSSKKLPPMVVAAFGHVAKADRTKFSASLGAICVGAGRDACAEAGISSLRPATDVNYAKVVKAYGN